MLSCSILPHGSSAEALRFGRIIATGRILAPPKAQRCHQLGYLYLCPWSRVYIIA